MEEKVENLEDNKKGCEGVYYFIWLRVVTSDWLL
jgi:hypothetical protein